MTFLPIVVRELIEASRRRRTYWIRVGMAAFGLGIGAFLACLPEFRTPQALGISMFVALAVLTYCYCALDGLARTADCLSEEKREGTLGLLFLTDLKGYDVVFGKLAATSLNALYGVLALVPVMAIPLLVGGVSINEFWRVVLAALNLLFFSLSLGLFASAISRDERRALTFAIVTLLIFLAGLPILAAVFDEWRPTKAIAWAPLVPCPSFTCVMAFDETSRAAAWSKYFYTSLAVVHGLGWMWLLLACFIVPLTWQDRPESPQAAARRRRWQRLAHGSETWRLAGRRRLLAINPVYWLTARDRFKGFLVLALLGLGGVIWALGLVFDPGDWKEDFAYVWTALIAHTVLKWWMATEASRRFALDRQSGALELLLSTPLSVREVIRGQTMALEKQFALPAVLVLMADFVFLMTDRRDDEWVAVCLAGMGVFVLDLFALAWLGMWRGLSSRRPNRAAGQAMLLITVLPWLLFFVSMIVLESFNLFRPIFRQFWMAVLLWVFYSVVVAAVFAVPARRKLFARFRELAATRHETKKK